MGKDVIMQKAKLDIATSSNYGEPSHAACGVGMLVDTSWKNGFKGSHQVVVDGIDMLVKLGYRAGFNPVTEESDGAGIRFFGLSAEFFGRKISEGEFLTTQGTILGDLFLREKQFAIGQYFLPSEDDALKEAQQLIDITAQEAGLVLAGWRNLVNSVDTAVLSDKAREKKPAIWQALLIPSSSINPEDFEQTVLKAALNLSYQAGKKGQAIHIVSQSAESIVYKGMLRPEQLADFYCDLKDEAFTAAAITVHARFATNTDPQWANAQPCVFFWAHNGELNSAPANAAEMRCQLNAENFAGIFPNAKLSDSMQFDADLANQMILRTIPLVEALVRLMPPVSLDYSAELKAMLSCFRLERTPYNGPAFAVAGAQGHYIAKLDDVGLRPSRWWHTVDQQGNQRIYAASDNYLELPPGWNIRKRGHLEPGGMIMVTPTGELLETEAILDKIRQRYAEKGADYFQTLLKERLVGLNVNAQGQFCLSHSSSLPALEQNQLLNRILFAAGWDYESEAQVVRYMAEQAKEKTAAMGDDTNPLHTAGFPNHLSYFFHQLFAQVSAPPLDSIKERERFSLTIALGATPGFSKTASKQIALKSPLLAVNELSHLENHPEIAAVVLDTSFPVYEEKFSLQKPTSLLAKAIQNLLTEAEKAVSRSANVILILSDRAAGIDRAIIPDLLAVAAVRRHLENKKLMHKTAIVADSYQVTGPHQASSLLAVGAKAVYSRGAYAKIQTLYEKDIDDKYRNYREALEICLLKTMGKMGITDINNYINGNLIAALGLNLASVNDSLEESPSLANIFSGIYSPLKGVNLSHIAANILIRHNRAYSLHENFSILPRSGYYMPEKNGLKHGYGPEVVNAFTEWMKAEDLLAKSWQMHCILAKKGASGYIKNEAVFLAENGFLDPRKKTPQGVYPAVYLETFRPSLAFKKMSDKLEDYRRDNPTSLRDYFSIDAEKIKKLSQEKTACSSLQTTEEIRRLLFSGSMSQGALTVSDSQNPHKLGAHETLTRGMNAIGANSASGEGGEAPSDLRSFLKTTRSKQIASGRFGVSAMQILSAQEVEIKIAQGAKPGEGGELPGTKISIRFAAQRGGLPGLSFISPPPHHDIYSIEDLEQLIYDIKSVNPEASVAVKLVSSFGIGTIAVGVAKAGADVINVAANSGGTGAAQQSSIKHAGFPAELGLAEVDQALQKTKLRGLVQLRVSGGFKTAQEIIIAAILGADLFEFGTTAMLTLGCKMQRTCNQSCQPGVATDGHLFKGDQINTERFFVNLAAAIQDCLKALGVRNLRQLRGRTDLLQLRDPKLQARYDFSPLINQNPLAAFPNEHELSQAKIAQQRKLKRAKEDKLIEEISAIFTDDPCATFTTPQLTLDTQDRSFGGRIAGAFAKHLEEHPQAKIVINSQGIAGQSFGFVLTPGMTLRHRGIVHDGCLKSMSGGEAILCAPENANYVAEENTLAGNAMLYGASGGRVFVNGLAGHRFGILLKGAEVVVEGVGDLAFEYMTSGTAMILGRYGKGLATGALGGILFVYEGRTASSTFSPAVRVAGEAEAGAYFKTICSLLQEHREKTNSQRAKTILESLKASSFKVLIPKELDKIASLKGVLEVIKTYQLRQGISRGMQIWLEQKTLALVAAAGNDPQKKSDLLELNQIMRAPNFTIFSPKLRTELLKILRRPCQGEDFGLSLDNVAKTVFSPANGHISPFNNRVLTHPKKYRPVEERLSSISGELDEVFIEAVEHLQLYIGQLTKDATGCSGCRAQSCAGGEGVETGCPSGKAINTINAILQKIGPITNNHLSKAQWKFLRQAFEVQIQESPFIAYTGAACPAPCQDACTETIPEKGLENPDRGGKLVGENVHIKDIEYYLFQLGRFLGWFNGRKNWTPQEIIKVFGSKEAKASYEQIMLSFKPPFHPPVKRRLGKELIIIGSGPAAMELAYKALKDGFPVRMYEQSARPGGLLADGIPAHKFDKIYIEEDFNHLQAMGLKLHLNSEVKYDSHRGEYRINEGNTEKIIASSENEQQCIAVCVGIGFPKVLSSELTAKLSLSQANKIVQAVDFLKAANDIAYSLKSNPHMSPQQQEALIKEKFAQNDPRNKKIVVIGGGDTAQDVIRWVARYFNHAKENANGKLTILVRGPQPVERAVFDGYPAPSRALTKENNLRDTEVEYIHGETAYLVEPQAITENEMGKLTLTIKESRFKYAQLIENHRELKMLSKSIPREMRPLEENTGLLREINEVDMIICALGFQGQESIPVVSSIKGNNQPRVYYAGVTAKSIVEAQASATNIYLHHLRRALGADEAAKLSDYSLFMEKIPKLNGFHATEIQCNSKHV